MRRTFKIFTSLTIISSLILLSCDKDSSGTGGTVSADDAKVEIRASSQEIQENLGVVMSQPATSSLMFLANLLEIEDEWKSNLKSAASSDDKYNLAATSKFIRENIVLKIYDDFDPMDGGDLFYNFDTYDFDIENQGADHLSINYPADDNAYANRQNNARLMMDNIEFVIIEYTDDWGTYEEVIPTGVDLTQQIDNQVVMTMDYTATVNNEGIPTSMGVNMTMQPYQLSMTESGDGTNFNSTMSFRENNELLLSYDLTAKYSGQDDDVENLSGSVQVTPLRFEGNINAMALDNCQWDDINCMNANFDVAIFQSTNNAKIGDLEFRMYSDPQWDEEWPEIAVVYADGSFEWLFEILDMEGMKAGLLARK